MVCVGKASRRVFGIDESAADDGLIVVAAVSYDMNDGIRRKLPPKKRGRATLGHHYREFTPEGDFRFAVITPEMKKVAQDVYMPITRAEQSLNGRFPGAALELFAAVSLMNAYGFRPGIDVAYVDAVMKTTVQKELMLDILTRLTGGEVPQDCIHCGREYDGNIPIVRRADDNAYRLSNKCDRFPDRRVTITPEDIISSASFLHAGIHHNARPSYLNHEHPYH